MKSLHLKRVFLLTLIVSLIPFTSVFADTFTDREAFLAHVGGPVYTVDFEGIATAGGQANAVNLVGDEFPGITLTAGPGADGLFVGIPDPNIPGGNNANFFAADFFPTSGVAVFSPDNYPSSGSPSPDGTLIVDFHILTAGVGVYFLDAEGFPSYIEAFDGPGGTGSSLGKVIVQGKPDNSQAFAGIVATGIESAVLVLGGGGDGVGIDDLCFGLPAKVDLCAGQHTDVGDVIVWNIADNLYVKYFVTEPDTCLTETHLHVAGSWEEIPRTKKNNPIPGHFAYAMEHDCVTEYTYQIPLSSLNSCELHIAAHAVVEIHSDGGTVCASAAIESGQGTKKNGDPVPLDRSNTDNPLGPPDSASEINFFSLGFGGYIILSFPSFVGGSLTVYETTWGGYPEEKADVYVSRDGATWTLLGTADNSVNLGTANLHPTEFQLGECVEQVKIVDTTVSSLHEPDADAFDVNAVCAEYGCAEETAWGDGCDGDTFNDKNWATYFTYTVQPCDGP